MNSREATVANPYRARRMASHSNSICLHSLTTSLILYLLISVKEIYHFTDTFIVVASIIHTTIMGLCQVVKSSMIDVATSEQGNKESYETITRKRGCPSQRLYHG